MRDKVYTLDIETNGLLEDLLTYKSFPYKLKEEAKFWVIVITDVKTGETKIAENEEITYEWVKDALSDCKILIAHNGVKFDLITMMLFGVLDYHIGWPGEEDKLFGEDCRIIDTLILSRLANPDRFGGHSLKAWGKRVGSFKDDYRQQCIDAGFIDKSDPKGAEFKSFNKFMTPYCIQDTKVNVETYLALIKEFVGHNWGDSVRIEHKLADLAVRREHLGFDFDKDLALKLVEDITIKMQELEDKVNPLLPPKPLNKTEIDFYTPPKKQTLKDGGLSKSMLRFLDRIDAEFSDSEFKFQGKLYPIPYYDTLVDSVPATINDMDHVKMHLIDLGWIPSEWRERDLTKDSKKVSLPYDKRIKALERWFNETMGGKFKKLRFEELGIKPSKVIDTLSQKLEKDWPVRVPTSPPIKVGVEKEICPNLIKMGEKVEFAKDFALYLTYRHRKSSIAGGDLEDLNLEEDVPNTGFLSNYREEDGRIPTPSIEIGAVTNRYTHKSVANIPRPGSIYGSELRSLFRAGSGNIFFGFDYSSLEARIMAHYVQRYDGGVELGELFIGEKPNDWHTNQAKAMGITRSDAKSVDYGLIYGAQIKKLMKMLGVSEKRAKEIYNMFWDNSPALKSLRDSVTEYWESNGKKFVLGLDGRKIMVRSKHALLNSLFQSAGIIFAKYITVLFAKYMEDEGFCIDPFKGDPDICSMIEYHDEQDMLTKPHLFSFKTFETKEEAKDFVSSWDGGQLSAISEGTNSFYVALPSKISLGLEKAVEDITKKLNVKVPMGFEYMLGNNWKECH